MTHTIKQIEITGQQGEFAAFESEADAGNWLRDQGFTFGYRPGDTGADVLASAEFVQRRHVGAGPYWSVVRLA